MVTPHVGRASEVEFPAAAHHWSLSEIQVGRWGNCTALSCMNWL